METNFRLKISDVKKEYDVSIKKIIKKNYELQARLKSGLSTKNIELNARL